MEAKTLLDEVYDKKCSRYFEVYFLTPTAFKHDGNYIFYPDLSLIYGSLMRKYSAFSQQMTMEDKDTLEELLSFTNNTISIGKNKRDWVCWKNWN